MPETTFLVVVSSFENVLDYDIVYMMKSGRVVQRGYPADALLDHSSVLSMLLRKENLLEYKELL